MTGEVAHQQGESSQPQGLPPVAVPPETPRPIDWPAQIAIAMEAPAGAVAQAHTFIKLYRDDSKPVEVMCDDGHIYIVKCLWSTAADRPTDAEVKDQRPDDQQGRRMFNDQVCGQLGRAMGVAVPHVALVEIPSELIGANPKQMGHLKPCVAHGSRRLPDMTGKLGGFDHHEKGDNRSRYCGLSVFFGWLFGGDVQFIQTQQPPHTVYSHDHGHFFPGGPMWTNASLAANAAQKAAPHPQLVAHLHLTPAELSWALGLLQAVTPDDIVTAVSSPPTEWQVPLDDRVALARFLHKRHGDLVSSLAQSPAGKAAP